MTAPKITSVGDSASILLRKEILTKLQIDKGDVSHVIENENGIELSPSGPEYEHQVKVPEDTMRGDHDI